MLVETEGIVLRATNFSEADVILNVFTKKFGKIGVYAKHARRLKSPLMSSVQIFSCSNMSLTTFDGRYRLSKAELIDNNFAISQNFERVYLGYYFLQFVEKTCLEEQTNIKVYSLLKEMLQLLKVEKNYLLQKVIFDLKMVQLFGYKPNISECINCGTKENLGNFFSVAEGGRICPNCMDPSGRNVRLDSTTFRLMEYIFSAPIHEIFSKNISEELLLELDRVMDRYIDYHFDNLDLSTRKLLIFKEEL